MDLTSLRRQQSCCRCCYAAASEQRHYRERREMRAFTGPAVDGPRLWSRAVPPGSRSNALPEPGGPPCEPYIPSTGLEIVRPGGSLSQVIVSSSTVQRKLEPRG